MRQEVIMKVFIGRPLLIEEECDGSKCFACEDTIYLKQFGIQIPIYLAGQKPFMEDAEFKVCASCKDVLEDSHIFKK
jgi:hypothetical protein